MSDHPIGQREPPKQAHEQSPLLLDTEQPHQEQSDPQKQQLGVGDYTHLDKTLQQLESFLSLLGFGQNSLLRFGLSWVAFLAIGVAVPVTTLARTNCSGCDLYQIQAFELDIVVLQACLAAVSLLCLSHNLRKYGIRKFLFVDQYSGQMEQFSKDYIQTISVYSIAQVVGIILCLNAASKISHRAQGIASIASRWHALATCSTNDASRLSRVNSVVNLEATNRMASMFSESDLESLDYIAVPTNNQLASYMTSYQRRQAFVMYLQNNPGGITIFGWTVDRGLVNTIFFLELSLVLFVLGRTTVFASSE